MSLLSVTVKRATYVGPQASQLNTYVALQLQNVKSTTVTVKGPSPAWEQDFLFETNRLDTGLLVEVWNKGLIWDKIVGYQWLPLQHVPYSNEEGAGQWFSIDAEQVIQDGYVVGTKVPTGHSMLLDCRLELPYADVDDNEYSELQRKLEVFNHIMDQEMGSLRDPTRRQQFIMHSGLSEDSDYTSDVSYPVGGHQANSSASQYLSVAHQLATPQRSLETSRENSYDNAEPGNEELATAHDRNYTHYGEEPDIHEPLSYNSRPKNHKETRYYPYSNYYYDKDSPEDPYRTYDQQPATAWYAAVREVPNQCYTPDTKRTARRPSLERQTTLYDEQQYSTYAEQSFEDRLGYQEEDSYEDTQGRYSRSRHKLPAIPKTANTDNKYPPHPSNHNGVADTDMGYDPGGETATDPQYYDEYYQCVGYGDDPYAVNVTDVQPATEYDYQHYYSNGDYNYDYNYAYQSNENLTTNNRTAALVQSTVPDLPSAIIPAETVEMEPVYDEKVLPDAKYQDPSQYYAEERWGAEGEAATYEYSDENGYYYEGQWYTWDGAYYEGYEYSENAEYYTDPSYGYNLTGNTAENDTYVNTAAVPVNDNGTVVPSPIVPASDPVAKTTASVTVSLVKPGLSFFNRAKEKMAELERKLVKDRADAAAAAEQLKAQQALKRQEQDKAKEQQQQPLRALEQAKRRESFGSSERGSSIRTVTSNNNNNGGHQRGEVERYPLTRDEDQSQPPSFDRTLSRESADLTSDESMHRRSSGETPHFEITDSGEWDDYKVSVDLDHDQHSPLEEAEEEEEQDEEEDVSRRGSNLSQRILPVETLSFGLSDRRTSIQSNLSGSRRERFEDFRRRRSSSICEDYTVDNSVIEPYKPYQHDDEDEEELEHMDRLRRTPLLDEEQVERSGKSVSFEDDDKGSKASPVTDTVVLEPKPKLTAKQRWHWAYNKVCAQINVSDYFFSPNLLGSYFCLIEVIVGSFPS